MTLEFERNPAKARANLRKHAVNFEEAATVFGEPLSVNIGDTLHSTGEHRFIIVRRSGQGRIILATSIGGASNQNYQRAPGQMAREKERGRKQRRKTW